MAGERHRLTPRALILLALVLACSNGSEDVLRGRWRRAPDSSKDVREMLAALQYLPGYEPAPDTAGIVTYDSVLACDGLNLVVSGHAPEAALMDMRGSILHRWRYPFEKIRFKDPPIHIRETVGHDYSRDYWRRARLLVDGSVLALFEGHCLIKIDKDSNLLWTYVAQAHHDLDIAENGDIYALVRAYRMHPRVNPKEKIVEDYIVILSPDGREQERFSVVDCLLGVGHIPNMPEEPRGDAFHTNSVHILKDSPMHRPLGFRQGNLLVSMREIDTIGVIDPRTRSVAWTRTGPWRAQHDPQLLGNGNVLLFDNLGDNGNSRVLEVNPRTGEVEWEFKSSPERTFHSKTCGTCQRLPNGNTLITESDSGRALEVTVDGEVVWEYVSPHRVGENRELVATLLHVVRITEHLPWLSG